MTGSGKRVQLMLRFIHPLGCCLGTGARDGDHRSFIVGSVDKALARVEEKGCHLMSTWEVLNSLHSLSV